ncbi:MAG: hypothetical protein P8Z81_11415, partial [Deinococcales bacterium]
AQFAVSKAAEADRTITRVVRLEGKARREELARMLSGRITPTSLDHAGELLEQAAATPKH